MGVGRPVATATTATAVGVAGMFFTWLTGKEARDDARATAREAREQQRLENAYIELLDVAERTGQWVRMVCPVWDTNPRSGLLNCRRCQNKRTPRRSSTHSGPLRYGSG